ncbi:MAG: ATP-binding protein [Leptospirales bacterium]
MVKRIIDKYLQKLAKQYSVITLTGPRQSGKTTLCKMAFPDKPYVNLESPDIRAFALEDPRGFLNKYAKTGAILDEIQRAPELPSYMQPIIDESKSKGRFILTGSQQFKITNSVNQSLAGRTALLKLLPLSVEELNSRPGSKPIPVAEMMYKGFYPRIYNEKLNATQALSDYFETYVERDIRTLSEIKNLYLFQKFVRACAGRSGQLLNLVNLGNDIGVSHTTAKEWLSLLQASYVVFLLEPWHTNLTKRLIKSPKLYFYDTGLAAYLLGIENIKHIEHHPLRGALFENMVVMEILKYRYNRGQKNNLNFYRDSNGNEIDVLYNMAQNILPIEIKAGETITKDYMKGFPPFEKLTQNLPWGNCVIYAGDKTQKRTQALITNIHEIPKVLRKVK